MIELPRLDKVLDMFLEAEIEEKSIYSPIAEFIFLLATFFRA